VATKPATNSLRFMASPTLQTPHRIRSIRRTERAETGIASATIISVSVLFAGITLAQDRSA
jgi:hypothetical protein